MVLGDPVATPESFPGYEPANLPRGFRVSRRSVAVKGRPLVGDLALDMRLTLVPDDFTRTEYRFWLDPSVELTRVEGPLGALEPERRGSECRLRFPYPPYRRELEIRFLGRWKTEGPVLSMPRRTPWIPEAGGPGPATEVRILAPTRWTGFAEGRLLAREARTGATLARFQTPGGVTPALGVGPWVGLSGRWVDLYSLGRLDRGDRELADFLDGCLELGRRATGFPEEGSRMPVVVLPDGFRPVVGPGTLLLAQSDEGWRQSWPELARRLLRAAWPVERSRGGWVDEAVPAYLAQVAGARGERPAWPGELAEDAPLGPPPEGDWERHWLSWAAQARVRGVRVLRALRGALGREAFLGLFRSLRQRAGSGEGTGTEELRQLVARPSLDGFFRAVVTRGHGLDFKVEEIRARGARRRGDLQGDVYGTWVRLRLGRGEPFRGPVPLLLETDLGSVRKVVDWKRPDMELELHTRSRVRRVRIDPGGWYPDPRPDNNTLAFQGFYREKEPTHDGRL